MANQALAAQVLENLLAHPELHDQGSWFRNGYLDTGEDMCGTTACVAGTAVMIEAFNRGLIPKMPKRIGERQEIVVESRLIEEAAKRLWVALGLDISHGDWPGRGFQERSNDSWCRLGTTLLEIQPSEGTHLFMEADRDDALIMLKEYANGD